MPNQFGFTFQRVDGIDDVVVGLEMKGVARGAVVDAFNGFNLCFRINGQKS